MNTPKRPFPALALTAALASIAAVAGTSFFVAGILTASDALSQGSASSAPSKTETASKAEASSESKKPPLDPSKLGEPLPRNLFVELNKLINPAVVSISASQAPQRQARPRDPLFELFEGLGGVNPYFENAPRVAQALGTGFIIRSDGLIVTNNHVVKTAGAIKVQLEVNSNKFYEAELIGRDDRTDIALLKIDAKKPLPVAPLGTSASVQVGEWVAAFGNPYGHAHTMTKGIVSAMGREITEINRFPFIQTDASINPGNSGGPLVNSQGYVIGVNTAIDARAQGIGFAIPIDNVKSIIALLEKDGKVKRGYIGVGLADLSPQVAAGLGLESANGVIIAQLPADGPAGKAGAQLYDIVLEFNGRKTNGSQDLINAVADAEVGSKAKMKVLRVTGNTKSEKTLEVRIAEFPEPAGRGSATKAKKYFGQKTPFNLGFKIADWSPATAGEMGLAPGGAQGPIVVDVDPRSPANRAGLQPGDVVLDINRQAVKKTADVIRLLKNGANIVRIARGDIAIVVLLTAGKSGDRAPDSETPGPDAFDSEG